MSRPPVCIFSSPSHTALTSSIIFLSTVKHYPLFLAAHWLMITSCKAISVHLFCFWPPIYVLLKHRPQVCWWLFQSSFTGWQPWPQTGPLVLQFTTSMFVLLHLDSCRVYHLMYPSKAEVMAIPAEDRSLICEWENGKLSKSPLLTCGLLLFPFSKLVYCSITYNIV